MNQVLRGGCRVFVAFWCLIQKQAFQKGTVAIPFFNYCSGGCWWMLLLDNKKKVAKKHIEHGFFGYPLLERRKRV